MNDLLALIPALPLAGFLVLSLAGRRLPKTLIALIGAGTISAAAIIAITIGIQFLQAPPVDNAYTQTLWQWMQTENFSVSVSLRVDALSLYFIHGAQSGTYSYDYFNLLNTQLEPSTARWIMMGFMIAFVIKLPMVPLHNWLPDAHSEAPTAGSLILAGLLLKTGAYGIIRFVLPLFPQASHDIAWWAMLFGVISIVYGAMLAYAQTDIKRLIAYTSVSHMGFVLLGIFAFREIAMQGVVMQMVTHGISTGALFVLAGMLKERLHTRDIAQMGGLWNSMPVMGGVAMLFTMASLGLPALGNFIAEFLILMGTFLVNVPLTVIATLGLVFSALYSLRLVQKVFLCPANGKTFNDFSAREMIIMAALSISIVLLGLYPQPVMDTVKDVVQQVVMK